MLIFFETISGVTVGLPTGSVLKVTIDKDGGHIDAHVPPRGYSLNMEVDTYNLTREEALRLREVLEERNCVYVRQSTTLDERAINRGQRRSAAELQAAAEMCAEPQL